MINSLIILMGLVFFYQFLVGLLVYKSVNARGAPSLNVIPCFAFHFLEMKPKTETMVKTVTTKMQTSTELNSKIPNSGILPKSNFR